MAVDLVARVQAVIAQARGLAVAVRLLNCNYRYRMAQVIPLQLALAGRAQLAVGRELPAQILFLAPLLQQVVVTEQTAMPVAAARAAALAQPRLEVERQGKALMVLKVTIAVQVILLAAAAVAQAQLVEVPHQAMQATVEQALQAASPALASPAQAAAQGVEMVAAQPKVERVDRAAVATAAGQMETQALPGQLTRAVAAGRVGINHLLITMAKLAVQA